MSRRYSSSVSPKGQITLPIDIRRELNIDTKDRVDIELRDGEIHIKPQRYTVRSLAGSLPPLPFDYVDGDLERIAKDERVQRYIEKFVREIP